jgi:hypothetical protein
MSLVHKFYYVLAVIHVIMVGLFASHFADWGNADLPVTKTLSTIGSYTASNNVFSFFAPGLSDQPYVVYAVKDTLNKEHFIDLQGNSPDFSKRVNNIYGFLTIPEARPVIAASLARFVLNRYPSSDKIRIAMVVQQIPGMEEFRNGERCKWQFWFNRDFQRDSLPQLKNNYRHE